MEGPGLAFAAFSQTVSLFPGASLWAILFFSALVIIGLSTLTNILEVIVCPLQTSSSLFRRYPRLLSGTVASRPGKTPALLPLLPRPPQSLVLTLTPSPAPPINLSVAKPAFVTVLICLGGFLGSLVFTSHAGSYIMSLFDDCLVPLTVTIIVAFQNVALAWIYGAKR